MRHKFVIIAALFTVFPSLARASFAGQWACQGFVVSIDDDDTKDCQIPNLILAQTENSFSLQGLILCPDGAKINFTEKDSLSGHSVLDDQGKAIGEISETDFLTKVKSGSYDQERTTQIKLNPSARSLHVQRDMTTGGIPIFRWFFDCKPL